MIKQSLYAINETHASTVKNPGVHKNSLMLHSLQVIDKIQSISLATFISIDSTCPDN